jgi:hypothetical protein
MKGDLHLVRHLQNIKQLRAEWTTSSKRRMSSLRKKSENEKKIQNLHRIGKKLEKN